MTSVVDRKGPHLLNKFHGKRGHTVPRNKDRQWKRSVEEQLCPLLKALILRHSSDPERTETVGLRTPPRRVLENLCVISMPPNPPVTQVIK